MREKRESEAFTVAFPKNRKRNEMNRTAAIAEPSIRSNRTVHLAMRGNTIIGWATPGWNNVRGCVSSGSACKISSWFQRIIPRTANISFWERTMKKKEFPLILWTKYLCIKWRLHCWLNTHNYCFFTCKLWMKSRSKNNLTLKHLTRSAYHST